MNGFQSSATSEIINLNKTNTFTLCCTNISIIHLLSTAKQYMLTSSLSLVTCSNLSNPVSPKEKTVTTRQQATTYGCKVRFDSFHALSAIHTQ